MGARIAAKHSHPVDRTQNVVLYDKYVTGHRRKRHSRTAAVCCVLCPIVFDQPAYSYIRNSGLFDRTNRTCSTDMTTIGFTPGRSSFCHKEPNKSRYVHIHWQTFGSPGCFCYSLFLVGVNFLSSYIRTSCSLLLCWPASHDPPPLMAPLQLFPDEVWGGLRTSRQFLGGELLVAQQDWRCQGEPRAAPGEALESAFSPEDSSRELVEASDPLCFSDLDDALDDNDDEDVVGFDSNWPRRDSIVAKRGVEIFVGGLTRSTRRDMLRDWFQHAGEVTEVRIARDKRRRRCRGYGYVRFSTSEQANRAIETMHRFEFKHGRFLGVLPSDENRTLFVGGLREEWSGDYICRLLKEKMVSLSYMAHG